MNVSANKRNRANMKRFYNLGFTLAELLLALGILAIIATLTVPKLLNANKQVEHNARFKEAFATLQTVAYTANQTNELGNVSIASLFLKYINNAKFCNNAQSEGCWPGSNSGTATAAAPALILHNGTIIMDIEGGTDATYYFDGVWIDVNGFDGPNLMYQDQFAIRFIYRSGSNTAQNGDCDQTTGNYCLKGKVQGGSGTTAIFVE
jgi:prepilin-type N-terminal cleavage/methylation domain-containing protein